MRRFLFTRSPHLMPRGVAVCAANIQGENSRGRLESRESSLRRKSKMKILTSLATVTALVAGIAVAAAQTPPPVGGGGGQKEGAAPQEQQRGGASQVNPAPPPTTGAGGMSSGSAPSTTKQDEQAGGANQSIERNPDGTTGGSKTNPSR
jgi:hypothetical protein